MTDGDRPATPRHWLTRDAILSGRVREEAARLGINMKVLSEQEMADSIARTLGSTPLDHGIWVFGYGSLIWNPAFHFDQRRTGRIFGHHRRFCLWTPLGRGSPERPGLVLGLDRGGSCQGVALRIAPDCVHDELPVLWGREMIGGAYRPCWVTVHTDEGPVRAIAFVMDHRHERYAGLLPDEQVADVIASAAGILGPCSDYLIHTVDHLAELGIRDRPLERLRARVQELQRGRDERA